MVMVYENKKIDVSQLQMPHAGVS